MKLCSRCKTHKDAADFHKCRTRKDGLNKECKDCVSIRSKADRAKHGEKRKESFRQWRIANSEHLKAKEAERRLNRRALCLVATVRTRARKRGMDFDLDLHTEAIQTRLDAGKCEITGVAFDLSAGRKFNSPSIDRIDPSKGYVYSNVRVVLNLVNAAMGDWGEDVLREVMTQWLK